MGKEFQKSALPTLFHFVRVRAAFQPHVCYLTIIFHNFQDKEVALGQGDDERAKEVEQKLNELEDRAEELDKKRTSTISSVSLINDRNR